MTTATLVDNLLQTLPEIEIVPGIECPQGHSELVPGTEAGPEEDKRWQIRPFRVCDADDVWWSQCLVCKAAGDEDGGWFA